MVFKTVKLFDLALAPPGIRESEDFCPLQPKTTDPSEQPLFWCSVGKSDVWPSNRSSVDDDVSTMSMAEYLLHQWLSGNGADDGETVVLTWSAPITAAFSQEGLPKTVSEEAAHT